MEKALCIKMFNTLLFIKAKQQSKCPVIGWINELGHIHLMEESVANEGEVYKAFVIMGRCAHVITNAKFKRQDSELWIQNNQGYIKTNKELRRGERLRGNSSK